MVDTGDPLLKGPIPLPEEGYASNPEDISPGDIWKRVKRPDRYG
jgi:hypothetical protein